MGRMIAVNSHGNRLGEDHHNAILTNAEVDRVLELHESKWGGYQKIADAFEVSKSLIRDICTGRRRCQTPDAFRVISG